jgi:hypothetical protein
MDQDGDFGTGARLVLTAFVSAVFSATLVIAIGQSILERAPDAPAQDQPALIRTTG